MFANLLIHVQVSKLTKLLLINNYEILCSISSTLIVVLFKSGGPNIPPRFCFKTSETPYDRTAHRLSTLDYIICNFSRGYF